MITPGTKLPEFKTTASVSTDPGKEFRDVSSKDFPGKWVVLYTYPKDFTFVCPTEGLLDGLGATRSQAFRLVGSRMAERVATSSIQSTLREARASLVAHTHDGPVDSLSSECLYPE